MALRVLAIEGLPRQPNSSRRLNRLCHSDFRKGQCNSVSHSHSNRNRFYELRTYFLGKEELGDEQSFAGGESEELTSACFGRCRFCLPKQRRFLSFAPIGKFRGND